jgi:hypothetical protein
LKNFVACAMASGAFISINSVRARSISRPSVATFEPRGHFFA